MQDEVNQIMKALIATRGDTFSVKCQQLIKLLNKHLKTDRIPKFANLIGILSSAVARTTRTRTLVPCTPGCAHAPAQ